MAPPASEAALSPSGLKLRLALLVLLGAVPAIVIGALLAVFRPSSAVGLIALMVVGILALATAWFFAAIYILRPLTSSMQREREAVQRLEELDRMGTEFVSMISHDLRNPLATIRGFAQLLRDRPESLTGDKQQQAYDVIVRQVDRMASLVDNVLDVSRLESDTFSYAVIAYEPAQLLEECAQEARTSWPAHDIVLETSRELPHMSGDPDRLKHALLNLMSNACRYSEDGTTVTVRARSVDGALRVDVADRGAGITPENAALLFQRYARLRTPDTKKVRGTGLGLYISRRIVEAHGGRIWVESEPGNGATFSIELPVGPPPPG